MGSNINNSREQRLLMTIEQRLDQLEQQNHRIERKNKRLAAALRLR